MEAESEVVGTLTVEAVHPADLPRELLEQKRTLNPDRFYAVVASGQVELLAFVIHEQDHPRPVCCWFMTASPLYDGVLIDTFVVDKAVRTTPRVRACMRVCREVCITVCRRLGLRSFAWSTTPDLAKRMMDLLDDRRVRPVETTLVLELGEAT